MNQNQESLELNDVINLIQQNLKPVMDTQDAASYLGVSIEWLKKARQTGSTNGKRVPVYIKIGKCVKYLKTDLDEYLNSLPKYEHINY